MLWQTQITAPCVTTGADQEAQTAVPWIKPDLWCSAELVWASPSLDSWQQQLSGTAAFSCPQFYPFSCLSFPFPLNILRYLVISRAFGRGDKVSNTQNSCNFYGWHRGDWLCQSSTEEGNTVQCNAQPWLDKQGGKKERKPPTNTWNEGNLRKAKRVCSSYNGRTRCATPGRRPWWTLNTCMCSDSVLRWG